jgi:hypothetical protein
MKVSSEFLSHLSSYLDDKIDLKTFREWQLPLLLDREKMSPEDQDFLFALEARYGELLAGVPEELFKKSLMSLLSAESDYIFVPVTVVNQPASLLESHRELRKALKNCADHMRKDGPCFCNVPNGHTIVRHEKWCEKARAALRKAEQFK